MTATVDTSQSPDVGTALRRFNEQLSREAGDQVLDGDMLDRLINLVRYQIIGPMVGTDQEHMEAEQVRNELSEQRVEAVQLANELAAAQSRVSELDDKLAEMAEARAAEFEASPRQHRDRHLFPVGMAGALPGPCECGETWPGGAR